MADLDSEEREDYVLRDSDLLILAARNEDDVSTIEVWVYEEASSSTGEGELGQGDRVTLVMACWPLPWWSDTSRCAGRRT